MSLMLKSWHPDRPVSKGATAYHDAVVNASWHIENISELIMIVNKKIKKDDVVVDFGAGTGGSAVYFLKSLKVNFKLWLVDNSAAWLGKAYEEVGSYSNVKFFLLEKTDERYMSLNETVGDNVANHVVSANTFHLIPNAEDAFKGISAALKKEGTFTFQSGNIMSYGRKEGVMMIDDSVKRVHEIALVIIQKDDRFRKYREELDKRIEEEDKQRKLVFPEPRDVRYYLQSLKNAGFHCEEPLFKLIKVKYNDWLNFLRVKRLQAGILPEVGGKEPSPEEEKDRDELITMAANQLFKELEVQNPFADNEGFTAEWVYITAVKRGQNE